MVCLHVTPKHPHYHHLSNAPLVPLLVVSADLSALLLSLSDAFHPYLSLLCSYFALIVPSLYNGYQLCVSYRFGFPPFQILSRMRTPLLSLIIGADGGLDLSVILCPSLCATLHILRNHTCFLKLPDI